MLSLPRTFVAGAVLGAATAPVTAVVLAAVRAELGAVLPYLPPLALLGALWAVPAAAAALAVDRVWHVAEGRRRGGAAAAAALAAAFLPLLLGYYPNDAGVARALLLTGLPAGVAATAVLLGWSRLRVDDAGSAGPG